MKKISIIIPVWGVEQYIGKCLDSLVNQKLEDVEIIVVNDGSPDNSQKIIDEYVKKYPDKVKSYIKENGGQGSARNYGIEVSTGEYIAFVDSDDFVELDMFEKMYKKAKKDKSDIVVCGSYNVSEDYSKKEKDVFVNNYDTDLENVLFGKMAVWNKIYKRNIIIDNKITFKEKVWYEDLAFTLKAIINSSKFSFINEAFYDYLIRQGSTMNNSNIERNLEILQAFDDVLEYIQQTKKQKYMEMIEFLAIDHIYVSAIVRVLRAEADNKLKREVINKLINYMEEKFPDFKENKYINTLSRNRKIIYNLITLKQYWLVNLIFKLK